LIILDTNVLSALMRIEAEMKVAAWLDCQLRTSLWTTSITLFEIRFGLHSMPMGRKRILLTDAFEKTLDFLEGRVAGFDSDAAGIAAELMARRKQIGRLQDVRDTMIAGIVLARHASLATRNTAHFSDISATVLDPWSA
jgi:toxin FitB